MALVHERTIPTDYTDWKGQNGTIRKANTKRSKLWELVKNTQKDRIDHTHYKFANIYRIYICAKLTSKIGGH
jgi:hypothetical protein